MSTLEIRLWKLNFPLSKPEQGGPLAPTRRL